MNELTNLRAIASAVGSKFEEKALSNTQQIGKLLGRNISKSVLTIKESRITKSIENMGPKLSSNSSALSMDPEVYFIGGTTLPGEALGHEGKKMEKGGHYLLENTVITTPEGEQIHVGTVELTNQANEWIESQQAGGENALFKNI